MADNITKFAPLAKSIVREPDVEHEARVLLTKLGYVIHARATGNKLIDDNWPSKTKKDKSKTKKSTGFPDLFLTLKGKKTPFCVWENKSRTESATTALNECKFYIEGVHSRVGKNIPNLPRLAAGFNGEELLLAYYKGEGSDPWCELKWDGSVLRDHFPKSDLIRNGISSRGVLTSVNGSATVKDLRKALWDLKTAYRVIPMLSSGRTPIDFTVALLTLRMLVEMHDEWGVWAEQPLLQAADTKEKQISERFSTLARRVLTDRELKQKYGDIFKFEEKEGASEVAFDFIKVLNSIDDDSNNFRSMFDIVDSLPPLINADFDIFGEVYQNIGDDATKKALGEFFTGRHIISGVIPIIFERSGLSSSLSLLKKSKIADIASGTGGFLTEALRYCRKTFHFKNRAQVQSFAQNSFYGFDLSHANASRARVNMYFAGDGFSKLEGGVDSLSAFFMKEYFPKGGFDIIMTNPPYGKSKYGLNEDAFLRRFLEVLKPGTGWGLIVLPTGILENPRSALLRFKLLKDSKVTDVISLPKHAFAPYTQQKTAILIIQKRKTSLKVSDGNWNELKKAINGEKTSLYIVDNDGYANSDKRYPTERKNTNGEWLHNELAKWTDKSGIEQPSTIYNALIKEKKPKFTVDEFNFPTGTKYSHLKTAALFSGDDIKLLPEIHLRRNITLISESDFIAKCEEVFKYVKGEKSELVGNIKDEIKTLLLSPIENEKDVHHITCSFIGLFEIIKGNQGFTEEVIYKNYDPDGIPVYGGGAEAPRFRVKKNTVTKGGKDITIHSGPAILVSMDGSSGAMKVIDEGEFCLNHHGAVLKPFDTSINLHWAVQQAAARIRKLASNQDGSSTLTLPQLQNFNIDIPIPKEKRMKIGEYRRRLSRIYIALFENS